MQRSCFTIRRRIFKVSATADKSWKSNSFRGRKSGFSDVKYKKKRPENGNQRMANRPEKRLFRLNATDALVAFTLTGARVLRSLFPEAAFQGPKGERTHWEELPSQDQRGICQTGICGQAVDMLCQQEHIRLHKTADRGPFGDDPAYEFMVVLTLTFLIGTVGFTEKKAGAPASVKGAFDTVDITEFMTVIGKDQGETLAEELLAKGFFKGVKQSYDTGGIVPGQDKNKLHVEGNEMEGKESFRIGGLPFYTIHLDDGKIEGCGVSQEIGIKVSGLRSGRGGRGGRPFVTELPLNGFREIKNNGIHLTGLNEPADGGFADGELLVMSLDDMVNRLSPFHERGNELINVHQLFSGKVKTIPGMNKGIQILLVSGPSIIETAFQMAVRTFGTGIAEFKGHIFQTVTETLNVKRAVFFGFMAVFTLFVASLGATDMAEGAGRRGEAVAGSRDDDPDMLFEFPGDGRGSLVEPVSDIAYRSALGDKSFDTDAVIRSKMGMFCIHKSSSFQRNISRKGKHTFQSKCNRASCQSKCNGVLHLA